MVDCAVAVYSLQGKVRLSGRHAFGREQASNDSFSPVGHEYGFVEA